MFKTTYNNSHIKHNMSNKIIALAALLGAVAVVLGAFGAHSLKAVLAPEQLQTFETGVRYHFYHAIATFLAGIAYQLSNQIWFRRAAQMFIVGIFCFSGSLYLLANREWLGIAHWRFLGPITPIGGLLFIVGWLMMSIGAWQPKQTP